MTWTVAGGKALPVAPKKKELEAELRALEARQEELAEALARLATHASVLALAVRRPESVPSSDLEAAVEGLDELAARHAHPSGDHAA